MSKYKYLLIILCLLVMIGCGKDEIGWRKIELENRNHLFGVNFADQKNGFAVGTKGIVLATIDGGLTWKTPENSKTQIRDTINKTFFVSKNNGWIITRDRIFYTGNGGKNWTVQATNEKFGLLDLHFSDSATGWICGGSGNILHTQTGGNRWDSQQTPTTKHLWSVHFVDRKIGWSVGEEGTIIHTKNGGESWIDQKSPTDFPLFAVHFIDAQNGWICGANGTILHTIDGGKIWLSQKSSTTKTIRDIAFVDRKNGWAIGEDGSILRTNDGGKIWKIEPIDSTQSLIDLHTTKKTVCIVGGNGSIYIKR